MHPDTDDRPADLTRRRALGLLGAAGAGAAAVPLLGNAAANAAPAPTPGKGGPTPTGGVPPVQGLHLTFGRDPARQMVVSWITDGSVRRPRVHYGTFEHGFGESADAETRTYVDGTSGRTVYVHHAHLARLRPDTRYVYAAAHDGATPDSGSFRTAPAGRAPFVFTSFGDQATPEVTWTPSTTDGLAGLDANSSPGSKDVVTGLETVAPLFHLMNGDLCYANLDVDRVRTWNNFFTNNTRSARFRPWMPCAGNHEIEKQNGPIGFGAYQTYFELPSTETDDELRGLWYSFDVGGVHFVSLENDDNCLQDGGDYYVRGYSDGRQLEWLKKDLRRARASRDVDWIVVCMHQVMVSSADFNGSDLGLRQAYQPLFDEYGVDLVVCGHEHDYERSLAVHGVVPGSDVLTPNPVSDATDDIDSEHGTVHMVLGGGGVSGTSNQTFFTDGTAKVITSVSAPGSTGKRTSQFTTEQAVWSAVRDSEHPYGFAAFAVDPGTRRGGRTSMHVTYFNVNKPKGDLSVFEQFSMHRRRADG